MQVFTYKDYIKAIHTFRINTIMKLAEYGQEYSLEGAKEDLIKKFFSDKREMVNFLNSFIQLNKKISSKQLIICNKTRMKLSDTEILYKIKNEEVYFLICHYSKMDNNFPYKLLNLCIDIVKEWLKDKKESNIRIYPIVIPIIIYTGNEKWGFPKKINSKYLEKTTYGENRINLSYNLVDISKISIKELSSKNTKLAKNLLIEKLKMK